MAKNLIIRHLEARRGSPADGQNYFFGYFDKNHWDSRQERLLAHRVNFTGRQVRFSDIAEVGILENGVFHKLGEIRRRVVAVHAPERLVAAALER